jgi:8-hydroxy-5-deazaflavin:NADPH oxidoreductase
MKTTIAIIGATGKMGRGLSHNLASNGYRLLLMGRDAEKTNELRTEIISCHAGAEVETVNCSMEASWEADIIIPAVNYNQQKELASKIREVVTGKIVINLVNPLNETMDGLLTRPDMSAAEEMQHLLPHSKVVKAFNTIFAGDFYQSKIDATVADCFVAGDDDDAVTMASLMVQRAGFNPLIAGNLSMSRTLESMMVLLIGLNNRYEYNWLAGWKVLHNS